MKKIIILIMAMIVVAACAPDKQKNGNPEGAANNIKIAVEVKNMAYQTFSHYFTANGSVEAVKEAFISPELGGRIKSIMVNEGDRVIKGQLLATLNSNVIERGIREVQTGLELARTIYKKRLGLWEQKIGSEIQYLQAKNNKESLENKLKTLEAQLEMSKIKAPISGIVDEIAKKEGELAMPGLLLIRVVNLKKYM